MGATRDSNESSLAAVLGEFFDTTGAGSFGRDMLPSRDGGLVSASAEPPCFISASKETLPAGAFGSCGSWERFVDETPKRRPSLDKVFFCFGSLIKSRLSMTGVFFDFGF